MSKSKPVFPKSFILRISREEWYRRVFTTKKYYPGVPRRWEQGGVILLARKAEKGDSFVGYGVVGTFVKRDQLPEEKRQECEKMGWRGELVFSELYRYEPPLPIRETILGSPRARGRYLHGYRLVYEEVESILLTAKEKCALRKVD